MSETRGWRVDLRGSPLLSFFFPLPSPSFQFAYHLLHLPLLTPEGPRGDFDLNRKSGVVCLKISSSLHSAGKTLALRLDSEAGLTRVQVLHREAGFDVEKPKVLIKSQHLAMVKCRNQACSHCQTGGYYPTADCFIKKQETFSLRSL